MSESIHQPADSNAKPNPQAAVLRGCPNTKSLLMEVCTPWSFAPAIPPKALEYNAAFQKWAAAITTQHLFYTASEGLNPRIKCSKKNPVRKLHGLIAQFDLGISEDLVEWLLTATPADLRPTWLSRTSVGSGVRLLWLFEAPLALEVSALAKQFLRVAYDKLKIRRLFPCDDKAAFYDLCTLYEVGRDWQKVEDSAISTDLLNSWLAEAAKMTRWADVGETIIPLEAVAKEVERQYPGRWEGPFEEGRRGVVFFNPLSKNPTAAIVTKAGMICFGDDQLFHPWRKILGDSFVSKFQDKPLVSSEVECEAALTLRISTKPKTYLKLSFTTMGLLQMSPMQVAAMKGTEEKGGADE